MRNARLGAPPLNFRRIGKIVKQVGNLFKHLDGENYGHALSALVRHELRI
jgi:hypothetical protein